MVYLAGGLASLRWETFRQWRDDTQAWWKELRRSDADKQKEALS